MEGQGSPGCGPRLHCHFLWPSLHPAIPAGPLTQCLLFPLIPPGMAWGGVGWGVGGRLSERQNWEAPGALLVNFLGVRTD